MLGGRPVPISPVVNVEWTPSSLVLGHGGRPADLTVDSSVSPQGGAKLERRVVR